MRDGNGATLGGRILLALLTLYALTMIAPDLYRLVRPLGAFGLATNADGLIYDVRAQFAANEDSPAWKAGLRPGDRLDLPAMRCIPIDTELCATNLALWGGFNYVMPGREGRLHHRSCARSPGPRGDADGEAAPAQHRRRPRSAAPAGRGHSGRSWRGLAGLDRGRAA